MRSWYCLMPPEGTSTQGIMRCAPRKARAMRNSPVGLSAARTAVGIRDPKSARAARSCHTPRHGANGICLNCVCMGPPMRTLELAHGGVEGIPQPVAEQIEGEYGHQNGQAREERDPPGAGDVIPAFGDHRAPGGRWGRDTGAKKAQRGFHDDHPAYLQ